MGIMHHAGRHHERLTGLDRARRLAVDQELHLAVHDVADLVSGMRMPPRIGAWRHLHARDHGFATRYGYIGPADNGAGQARILRQRATCHQRHGAQNDQILVVHDNLLEIISDFQR
ncbi:hypothetical protein AU476_01780 [Cupriavidus sp. UYMSc13B]|nr:hypothetical protein AU476_01780 [Cupriavidus sp. UYMSc13B]